MHADHVEMLTETCTGHFEAFSDYPPVNYMEQSERTQKTVKISVKNYNYKEVVHFLKSQSIPLFNFN